MKRDIRQVLGRVIATPAFLLPTYYGMPIAPTGDAITHLDVLGHLQMFAEADVELENAAADLHRTEMISGYGLQAAIGGPAKPFAFAPAISAAIIPVHGTLLNRFPYSWSFVTGYSFVQQQLAAALADPDVALIIFDINSPGGESAGCEELANAIYASREVKPSIAVVDSLAASAAYMIGSAATKVYATPSSWTGSIGVVWMHADVSGALDKFGIKVTFVFAGDHKVDGNSYEPLPSSVKADMKVTVDKVYGRFVDLVAKTRGMTADAVRGTQARVYASDDALALGLIDGVATPGEAVAAFLADDGDEDPFNPSPDGDNNGDPEMVVKTDAEITEERNAAVSSAVTAERGRISAILNCAEAKDKPKLAQQLASMGTSADDAKIILAAATPEVASVAVVADPANPREQRFRTAMDGDKHPDLSTGDGGGAPEGGGGSKANPILAAVHKATGNKRYSPANGRA